MNTVYKATERLSITQVIDAGIRDFTALGIYAYLAESIGEAVTAEDLDLFSHYDHISMIDTALRQLVEAEVIEEIEEIEGGAA